MKGTLVWTGCRQSKDEDLKILELWAFPDGTLNLLAVTDPRDEKEHLFPIAFEQLEAVSHGKPIQFFCDGVLLKITKKGDDVCAECIIEDTVATQNVPLREFREVLDRARIQSAFAV